MIIYGLKIEKFTWQPVLTVIHGKTYELWFIKVFTLHFTTDVLILSDSKKKNKQQNKTTKHMSELCHNDTIRGMSGDII